MAPRLDPLIPALAHAVTLWGAGGRAVAVVHDEHHYLTAPRIAQLRQLLDGRGPSPGRKPCRLVGVRLVDSRSDPRVQVADLLAGTTFLAALAAFQEGRFDQAADMLRGAGRLGWRDRSLGPLLVQALFRAGLAAFYGPQAAAPGTNEPASVTSG